MDELDILAVCAMIDAEVSGYATLPDPFAAGMADGARLPDESAILSAYHAAGQFPNDPYWQGIREYCGAFVA